MIPIVIEPSMLSFNLDSTLQYDDKSSEINDFIEFSKKLKSLFDELEEKKLKIAMTKELYECLESLIPLKIYSDSSGIKKNAAISFSMRFRKLIKVVHTFGAHNQSVLLNNDELQFVHLLETDIYLHWLDMCGLITLNKLLPEILKSSNKSIFKFDYSYLIYNENQSLKVNIHNNLDAVLNSKLLKTITIIDIIKKCTKVDKISCSGTGDHSSMWKRPIRKLDDVPYFERQLLIKLIETGLVKSIKFLSFEKNLPSVSSPVVMVNSFKSMTSCDILMCTLRGKGIKQHCQDIQIEVLKGSANLLIDVFGNQITIQSIDNVLELPQQIALTSN